MTLSQQLTVSQIFGWLTNLITSQCRPDDVCAAKIPRHSLVAGRSLIVLLWNSTVITCKWTLSSGKEHQWRLSTNHREGTASDPVPKHFQPIRGAYCITAAVILRYDVFPSSSAQLLEKHLNKGIVSQVQFVWVAQDDVNMWGPSCTDGKSLVCFCTSKLGGEKKTSLFLVLEFWHVGVDLKCLQVLATTIPSIHTTQEPVQRPCWTSLQHSLPSNTL